jgi:WD40 repeat protein
LEKSGLHLVASCGADSTIRLWNLETLEQLSEMECPKDEKDDDSPLIPIKIALHPKGTMAAVIYDKSDRFDVYSIESSSDAKTASLVGHLHTTKCATPLLSVLFKDADTLLTLQKEPNYLIAFEVTDSSLTLMEDATSTICQKASELSIKLPEAILERDNWGNIKLEKLNETRGPASEDAPWNRIERVDIARERQKRHKKRKLEKKDVEQKE